MIYIGIDPGQSGAIASIYQGMKKSVMIFNLSATEADIREFLEDYYLAEKECLILIEKVHSMPHQGVASTFKFGQNYGFLRGLLSAYHLPFSEVTPQAWQKHFLLGKRKDEGKTEHKGRIKQAAQNLFPRERVTLKNADALMIMEYLRQREMRK